MARAFLILTACALAGCITDDPGFRGVEGVREITPAEAASCTQLSNITARPGVYGPLAQQGLEYSRNKAMQMAKERGANAILFEQVSPGTQVYEIRAESYRC